MEAGERERYVLGFMRLTDTKGTLLVHGNISRNGFLGWFAFESFQRGPSRQLGIGTSANLGSGGTRMLSNELIINRPLDKITTMMFQLSHISTVMEAVIEMVDESSAKTRFRLIGHRAVVSKVVVSSIGPASESSYLDCASIDFTTVT